MLKVPGKIIGDVFLLREGFFNRNYIASNNERAIATTPTEPSMSGPAEYNVEGVTYLTPADQEQLPYRIVSLLPWNHFGRKNVGYLYAVHHGAKVCVCEHECRGRRGACRVFRVHWTGRRQI